MAEPKRNEDDVEITPKMIEAGVEAYFMYEENWPPDSLVSQVFRAMWLARSNETPQESLSLPRHEEN